MQKEGKAIPDEYKHYLQDFSMSGGKVSDTVPEAFADALRSVKNGVQGDLAHLNTTILQFIEKLEQFQKNFITLNDTTYKKFNEALHKLSTDLRGIDNTMVDKITEMIKQNNTNKLDMIKSEIEKYTNQNTAQRKQVSDKFRDITEQVEDLARIISPDKPNLPEKLN